MATANQHDHQTTSASVTETRFESSCKPAVQKMLERGVGLLHSFWFSAARETFSLVAHSDVDCAMAWWGIALSEWGDPFESSRSTNALVAGEQAMLRAAAANHASMRERLYLAAVAELFRNHRTVSQRERVRAYRRSMVGLSAGYPDDLEAAVFSALAQAQLADQADPTDANRVAAAAALQKLFRQHPDHPGIAHYLLRTLDHPRLAVGALAAARRYRELAPPTPSAMLAPTRIFLPLALWQEALDASLASADAARRDGSVLEELRALDVQTYAYIENGQHHLASEIVRRVVEGMASSTGISLTDGEHVIVASMRARNLLERGTRPEALKLLAGDGAAGPAAAALMSFARGVGAARTGQLDQARRERSRLTESRDMLQVRQDWYDYVESLGRVLDGWILFKEGRVQRGMDLLTRASGDADVTRLPNDLRTPIVSFRKMLTEMRLEARAAQPR